MTTKRKKETFSVFEGDGQYLTLSKLAQESSYRVDFLAAEINAGRLKSFKMGDDWLTTNEWFEDYKKQVRQQVESELEQEEDTPRLDKWITYLPQKQRNKRNWRRKIIGWRLFWGRFNPNLRLSYSVVTPVLLLVVFLVALGGPLININRLNQNVRIFEEKKTNLGNSFLHGVNLAYSFPTWLALQAEFISINLFNQGSIFVLSAQAKTNNLIVQSGELAIEKINPDEKIYDEYLTDSVGEFWQSRRITLGEKVGQVAGATDVRKQNYYEEWADQSLINDNNLEEPKESAVDLKFLNDWRFKIGDSLQQVKDELIIFVEEQSDKLAEIEFNI